MPRANTITLATLALAAATLVACGNSTGGYAPAPAPFEPPAQDLAKAKDPKFKPLVQAILAQRKAAKELAEFRAQFGSAGLDEAAGKKYGELFARVAAAGQKVSDLAVAANFEGEDRRVWDAIASMTDEQLGSLAN